MVLIRRLRLLAGDGIAGSGIDRIRGDQVGVAELGDGAGDVGLVALAHADVLRHGRCKGVVRRLAQVFHALAQMLRADDGDDGGLLQLDDEGLREGGVKNRVARFVLEIGDDNGTGRAG